MNCVLTNNQQRLLFGKVGIDLKNNPDFNFNKYARDFYDLIVNKTKDPVLATNYVSLLPLNIRAVMGVDRTTFRKLAPFAGQIADLEAQFEDFNKVQDFVKRFQTEAQDLVNLEKTIQKASLNELPEPVTIIPNNVTGPIISLWDLNFDVTKENELKPEMALYTNVKKQLIANKRDDGTSLVDGKPVKMQIVSMAEWPAKNFYPNVEAAVLAGDERIIGFNKKGIALLVTDLQGNPIYFDSEQKISSEGKPAYYIFKAPKKVESGAYIFDFNEKAYVEQLKRQRGLTQEQAETLLNKQNELFVKIRETILADPNTKMDVLITGGFSNIVTKPTPQQLTIGNVFDFQGGAFIPKPFVGREAVYYFNYPGTSTEITINRPNVPDPIISKLVSLLTDLVVTRNGAEFKTLDKIALLKQYIYLNPKLYEFREGPTGDLEVLKFGVVVNYTGKDALAEDLRQMFRNNILTGILTPSQLQDKLNKGAKVLTGNLDVIKGQPYGSVYQYTVGDKTTSYLVGPLQLKIDAVAAQNNKFKDFEITNKDGILTINVAEKPYYPFIQSNFLVDKKQIPPQEKEAGQTLEFALAPEAIIETIKQEETKGDVYFDEQGNLVETIYEKKTPEKISGINEVPVEPKTAEGFLRSIPKDQLFKRAGQENIEATEEQIAKAKVWYKNNPLSNYFSFEAMFSVINRKGSNNIAEWTNSGITLFKGSDYSDLYHEAWHGFTQGFLSKDEKTDLYNEAKKLTGSFIDYAGNKVKFSEADDLQIEEYLAEDFREYMLSGGKKVLKTSPVRNSIFRRILNFLKELFGNASVKQTVIDEKVNQKVSNLYNKLRIGDLASYTFAAKNRNFDTLNKALRAIDPVEVEKSLSFEQSGIMFNAINSLFSEAIDELNKTNADSIYTTAMTSTLKGVKNLYNYVKVKLEKKLADLTLEESTPEIEDQKELLSYALRNFGDIEKLYEAKPDYGVLGYHLFRTDLIDESVYETLGKQAKEEHKLKQDEAASEDDENEEEGRDNVGKNYWEEGNSKSAYEIASKELLNILKSLYATDVEGVVLKDMFGFPQLLDGKSAFYTLQRITRGSKDLFEMIDRLEKEKEVYYPIKQLLIKMGPVYSENQTDRQTDLWTKFYHSFNKYRTETVQTTVQKTVKYAPGGGTIGLPRFDLRIGNALSETTQVNLDWQDLFKLENENPFIKNDEDGNYLDTESLVAAYPTLEKVGEDPIKFLKDIGIVLEQVSALKVELTKRLTSGDIRLSGIYNNIVKLHEAGIMIRNITTYLNGKVEGVEGLKGQTGPYSNYGKLLALQLRYSKDYNDSMVQDAAGNPKSEDNLQSSLFQNIIALNAAPSYVELVNNAPTAQYNNTKGEPGRPYNPYVDVSIMMNARFDMSTKGGKQRNNKFIVDNLSGINSRVNEGLFKDGNILSQSDAIGKLLTDFHLQLVKFTPELTRAAGKNTSLAVYMRNYYNNSRNPRLFIDSEDFIDNAGLEKFQRQLIKYISGELNRINYCKELLNDKSVEETDFEYLKRGSDFVAFAGVLSAETKDKLKAVKGDLLTYLATDQGLDLENQLRQEIGVYFNKLSKNVEGKLDFVSPTLLLNTAEKALENGTNISRVTNENILKALAASFVANNWIQHFEEQIILFGDVGLYKDFFKRNASINSSGEIPRNDEAFRDTVNNKIKKGFTQKLGITMEEQPWTGQLNTAIVSDVLVKSAYYDKYKKASKSITIDEKYGIDSKGKPGINEADAWAAMGFDTYRIMLKSLSEWSNEQESAYQDLLNGKPASEINITDIFPVIKMGMFGPIQSQYLPLTGLHKFAIFPLVPGAISGNLEELHNKMMREDIGYMTFESGSKVATITKRSGMEPLYSDVKTRTLSEVPFVKNTIFLNYLKLQVKPSTKYKGQLTFPTQLRSMVDIGMFDQGVPIDYVKDARFKDKESAWESLDEDQKKKASKKYELKSNYLDALKRLQKANKAEILNSIGDGDITKLLGLVSAELKRGDVGEHEWAYIQTIKGKDVAHALDISTSADMIEKVIIAYVKKRLINLKVRGEQLTLIPGTLFEDKAFAYQEDRDLDNPTEEDLKKYGTNDLPTYHIGENGLIQAAKVKIALQGDFKKLLNHPDVKNKAVLLSISDFQALNLLIKDEDWLSEGDNRYLVTMVGARIPTQGPNSEEFVEVYEFFPEITGSFIVAPSEMTSKGGSDYDYDKLPLIMPSITEEDGKVFLSKGKNNKGGIENDLIRSIRGMAEQPSNFEALITPNDTNLVKPTSDAIYEEEFGKEAKALDKQGTKVFEPEFNIKIQQDNYDGKSALGIGAIYNKFNAVFNSIGLTLNESYGAANYRAILKFPHNKNAGNISLSQLMDANKENSISEVVSQLINGWVDVEKDPWISYIQGNKEMAPAMLFMLRAGVPIKTVAYFLSQPVIRQYVQEQRKAKGSFSEVLGYGNGKAYKVTARNKVLDQFGLQGATKAELYRATLLFTDGIKEFALDDLIAKTKKQTGLGAFTGKLLQGLSDVSDIDKTSLTRDEIIDLFAKASSDKEVKLIYKRLQVKYHPDKKGGDLETSKLINDVYDQGKDTGFANLAAGMTRKDVVDKDYKEAEFDLAVFLHFLEIENMAKEVDEVQRAFDVDKTRPQTFSDFFAKIKEIGEVKKNSLINKKYIERLLDNSPLGPFYVQEFALDVFSKLLPVRTNKKLNEHMLELPEAVISLFKDEETAMKTYKDDLLNYIFQNTVRDYKGTEQDDVQEGELVPDEFFTNNFEKRHFNNEKRKLRSQYAPSDVKGDIDFENIMVENGRNNETKDLPVQEMELLAYEQWLNEKALFNILNPYQLFKAKFGMMRKYVFILKKYEKILKPRFSLLSNMKTSSKEGINNLQLATIRLNKDQIDLFHENFKDLSNSAKLVEIEGITQKDADYISDFFGKLPLYLYMQTGPNTRNPFSFNRVMPNDKILRILEEPIKNLDLDDKYLEEYTKAFTEVNIKVSTRTRFKDYLMPDEILDKLRNDYFSTIPPKIQQAVNSEINMTQAAKFKELGRSVPKKTLSNTEIIKLRQVISKVNNELVKKGINRVYRLPDEDVKQVGQSDNYTWQVRVYPGKLDVETKANKLSDQDLLTNRVPRLITQGTEDLFNQTELSGIDTAANYSQQIIRKMADVMGQQVGVDYSFISPSEASELTKNTQNPWRGQKSFFFNGQVYFIEGGISPSDVLHEFIHPIIKNIAGSNKPLFNALYDKAKLTDEGKKIIEDVSELYPDFDKDDDNFKEEVLVRSIEQMHNLNNKGLEVTSAFKKFVDDLLYAIKQLLRNVFGQKIQVHTLSPNTTLQELSDILKEGGKFELDPEVITDADLVAYKNEYNKILKGFVAEKADKVELEKLTNTYFETIKKYLVNLRKQGDLGKLSEVLENKYGTGELQKMQKNLKSFQTQILQDSKELEDDVELTWQRTAAVINSLGNANNMIDHIAEGLRELVKDIDNKDNVRQVLYYQRFLNYWGDFVANAAATLEANGVREIPFINNVVGNVNKANRLVNDFYFKASKEALTDVLTGFMNEQEVKAKSWIEELERKKAPKELIDKAKADYENNKLTPKTIEDALKGKLKDVSIAGMFMESYSDSPDPVVGGLSLYIKNHLTKAEITAQQRFSDIAQEIKPLLDQNNYNQFNSKDLGVKLGQKEKVGKVNPETGEFEESEIWRFQNQFIGADIVRDKFLFDVKQAGVKYSETHTDGDKQKLADIQAEWADHKRKFWNDKYTEDFYKVYDLLKQDAIGNEAKLIIDNLYDELNELSAELELASALDVLDIADDIESKRREIGQVSSLTDIAGNPKVGKELEIAERLQKFNEAIKGIYDSEEIPDAFKSAYQAYEQKLQDEGKKPRTFEYEDLLNKWKTRNIRAGIKEDFWNKMDSLSQAIKAILSTVPQQEPLSLEIEESYKEIRDLVKGNRDESGQPLGAELSPEKQEKIKLAQERIDAARSELDKISGLSKAEQNELTIIMARLTDMQKLSNQETVRLSQLMDKQGRLRLNKVQRAELRSLFSELDELRSKEPTDSYVDTVNDFLNGMDNDALLDVLKSLSLSKDNVGRITNTELAEKLFILSSEFETWFKRNHILKESFNYETNEESNRWERTYAWNVIRPREEKYYEHVTVENLNGEKITLQGLPSLKYYKRLVKPEYLTPEIVGVTKDNRGYWLPKTMAQGAADDRYVNKEYLRLKQADPKLYSLLEKMKEIHLQNQEGAAGRTKLWLDMPRYSKDFVERLQSSNPAQRVADQAKRFWTRIKDGYENGFNYDDNLNLVKLDLLDNEETGAPISGLANLPISEVSTDIVFTSLKYMMAIEKNKALNETAPLAQVIQKVVNDKNNIPSEERLAGNTILNFVNGKKSKYVRQKAVNNMIEKQYQGIQNVGFASDSALAQNLSNFLFKRASTTFLAFNIPSALKNAASMKFQLLIEAAAGKNLTTRDLIQAEGWATATTFKYTIEIYKNGPKSLDIQIVELFDPERDKFQKSFGQSFTRTPGKDSIKVMDRLNDFRQFVQLQAGLQTLGAMMIHQKLPTKDGGAINYLDAWELRDGKIHIKDSVDSSYGVSYDQEGNLVLGDKFVALRNKYQRSIDFLNGSMGASQKVEAERYLLFRYVSFFRRFLTSMLLNRFAYSGSLLKGTSRGRWDYNLSDSKKGWYIEFAQLMLKTFKSGFKNLPYMTGEEKASFLRMATEIGTISLIQFLIVPLIFGYDDEDKDRFKKLKAKSGALPFLGVEEDPAHPFQLGGWLSNHLLLQLLQINQENSQFLPFPNYGLNSYKQMLDVKSVVAGPTIKSYIDLVNDAYLITTGNEKAYYQKDANAYEWAQQDQLKLWNHIGKAVGFNASSIDPTSALKNFESFQNR